MSEIDKFSVVENKPVEINGEKTQEMLVSDAMKELGMTMDDATRIIDCLFSSGVYKESFTINKVTCEFRTRSTAEETRLHQVMAAFKDMPYDERMHEIQLHNLATSLTKFGLRQLKLGEDDESYKERRKVIMTLPIAVFTMLAMALGKFDMKVTLACQDSLLKTF